MNIGHIYNNNKSLPKKKRKDPRHEFPLLLLLLHIQFDYNDNNNNIIHHTHTQIHKNNDLQTKKSEPINGYTK